MNWVDWARLRGLTAYEIVRVLIRDRVLQGQSGAHQRYWHADRWRVTVSFYQVGETFAIGTLRSMVEEASLGGMICEGWGPRNSK